jgi:hypothetical protein
VFILLADGSRGDQLRERLQKRGVTVDRLASEGRYLFVDFADEFAKFTSDGQLDEARFGEAVATLFDHVSRQTTGDRPRIALCGEGAPCLWKEGHANAAICIERVWNMLSNTWAVDSLCAYDADLLRRDDSRDAFHRICSEHTAVHFRRAGAV